MRDFKFAEQERPTMANFNARFDAIAALANGLGNEYVWEKYLISIIHENITSDATFAFSGYTTLQYGSSFTKDENNKYSIVNEQSITISLDEAGMQQLVSLAPTYIMNKSGAGSSKIYYLPLGSNYGDSSKTIYCPDGKNMNFSGSAIVRAQIPTESYSFVGYVNSPDPNAYPPTESDGYTYKALGQLANLGAKIATGSYTGTGTYGASNPNSLTFDFEPKLILIPLHTGSDSYGLWYQSLVPKDNYYTIIPFSNVPTEYTRGAGFGVTSSDVFGKKAGNTLYWYNTRSAYNQFNDAATDYYWVAIG